MTAEQSMPDIATPAGKPRGLGGLLLTRGFTLWASRLAAHVAKWVGKPLKIGNLVLAMRYNDVRDVLARDLDFIIKPINDPPFEIINYRFVLGMDRSVELTRERAALYRALAGVDMAMLQRAALHKATALLDAASLASKPSIDIIADYARPIAAGTARALFGLAAPDEGPLIDAARAVFHYGFLNGTGNEEVKARAIAAAHLMTAWLNAEIAKRRAAGILGHDMMGGLLAQPDVSDDQARRTLGGMFVGSIDPVAGATARIMTVMMRDNDLRARATRDADNLPAMMSWCQEAMRRWPNSPILGRKSARATTLSGVTIPAGATVIAWTQAAMFDASAFPEPLLLRPDRAADAYFHFGAGLHPCAGRGINAWQLPLLVGQLLKIVPQRLGRLQWAGPFPEHLSLEFAGENL